MSPKVEPPGADRVETRQDFARELTLLREQAGLTVRQVASKVGVQGARSTIGDWFAGRRLPSMTSRDLLVQVQVLAVCGFSDGRLVEQWLQAWWRVRRVPGHRVEGPEPYRGLASFQPEDAERQTRPPSASATEFVLGGGLRSRRWVHMLGFRGHFTSQSR